MALTTLTQIKNLLGVPDAIKYQDAQLGALQAAAEATVKAYCRREFEPASKTEFLTGNNTRWLQLRHRPVTAVTAVYEDFTAYYGENPDGSFAASTLLTQGVDYALDLDTDATSSLSGLLVRVRTVWQLPARIYVPGRLYPDGGPAFGNVKVVYTSGYSPIPQDVQYAVCLMVSYLRRNVGAGASLHGERIGDYSYELGTPRFPQAPEIGSIRSLLARYRELAC